MPSPIAMRRAPPRRQPQLETITYKTAVDGSVPDSFYRVVDNYIWDLKRFGIWDSITALYMLAAPTEAAALRNVKNPNGTVATNVGPATFVAGKGFTGNGTTAYIDTGILNASLYSQNNGFAACIGVRVIASAQTILGQVGGTVGISVSINNGTSAFRGMSSTADTPTGAPATSIAYFAGMTRNNAADFLARYAWVANTVTRASAAPSAVNAAALRFGGVFSSGRAAMAMWGTPALTAQQLADCENVSMKMAYSLGAIVA